MLYSVVSFQIGFSIFLLGSHFQHTDGYSLDHYNTYVNRYRRQTTTCPLESFKCGSGECIPEENVCDGKVECKDESDEQDDCRTKIICNSSILFQCNYGACIETKKKCDGNKDCRDNSDETSSECQITTANPVVNNCGFDKFRCDSGQCIDDSELCDGVGNCNDKSDESRKACRLINCPSSTYRCNYGACVKRNARCDGEQDCVDGSDEAGCPGRPTPTPPVVTPTVPNVTPPVTQGCRLPNNPSHGKYIVSMDPTAGFKPGDIIPKFSLLTLNCNRGYLGNPPSEETEIQSYCLDKWTPDLKTCARACPSLMSKKSTKIECRLNGDRLKSCINPIENTIASITCETLYEEQSLADNPQRLCKDGTWDYSIPTCTPVCGQKRAKGVTNIVNGQNAILGDYPWQVAVYNVDKIHICGGSIINQRIVLSAAHCFADNDGKTYPKENYEVAAGKYYHQYDHPNDLYAQYSNIQEIHIPNRYRGIINHFEADLAILILSTPFSLSTNVQPVCIDLQNEYDEPYSTNGTVTGWGFINEQKDRTEVLKELSLPYIPYDTCFDAVPKSFRRFITYDKICAGYLDQGTAVCQGDSGGPLVFPKIRVNDERYYVRGIVSTSPATNTTTCDSNQYGTYTSVAKHVAFIRDVVTLNRLT